MWKKKIVNKKKWEIYLKADFAGYEKTRKMSFDMPNKNVSENKNEAIMTGSIIIFSNKHKISFFWKKQNSQKMKSKP